MGVRVRKNILHDVNGDEDEDEKYIHIFPTHFPFFF